LGSQAAIVAAGGGSKIGADAIAADEIKASVCNRPQLLGELMFKALYAAVKDPNAKKGQYITYDMPMITKQNLDQCPDKW
jgi:ribose transport system substrate-binding protein